MTSAPIALFLPTLGGGGAERVMVTLANGLAARGHRIDLVLASARGPYLQDVSAAVRVVDFQVGRVFQALFPLARYLRRERPRALLAAMTHANVIALLARTLSRVSTRVVLTEHNTISVYARRRSGMAERLMYALVPLLYPRADAICAVSRAAADDLAAFVRLPSARVETIYNPFDLERIHSLAAAPLEHPWFKAGQPPVVVSIGRLTEQKDFPTLIRAFASLVRERQARLLILGEGPRRGDLERLCVDCGLTEEGVSLPGFVDNPFAYLSRAALFVLSSRWEGFGNVLAEAMACGTPVISTDCPCGPREILEGGRWGRLVTIGDEDGLTRAMASVLDTPANQRPQVALRAQDFAVARAVEAYGHLLRLG